jgi:hypothetical protein
LQRFFGAVGVCFGFGALARATFAAIGPTTTTANSKDADAESRDEHTCSESLHLIPPWELLNYFANNNRLHNLMCDDRHRSDKETLGSPIAAANRPQGANVTDW